MSTIRENLPLVVDLDGTLAKTDLLVESCFQLLRAQPLVLFILPVILFMRGKAALKAYIAERVTLDPALIPYNEELVAFLREEKAKGRFIVLATASNFKLASSIADYFDLFDDVYASTASVNLSGEQKQRRLVAVFGENAFAYAGNAHADKKVWHSASEVIVVNPEVGLIQSLRKSYRIDRLFVQGVVKPLEILKALRCHQWVKNLLIFIPLFLSHEYHEALNWFNVVLAFFTFCLCASSVYLLNDLIDLPDDRVHPDKCKRPFASGSLSPVLGVFLIPVLLLSAVLMASLLSMQLLVVLLGYYALTVTYSFLLKRKMIADVIALALLYTCRIVAGTVVLNVPHSFWLLAYSMFIFLSLAIIKRYVELRKSMQNTGGKISGRDYQVSDFELLASLGGSSGYISVLVIALYLNSQEVTRLYQHPQLLWLICPILLYWVSRTWLKAHRGLVASDPIIWALKDRVSYVAGGLLLVIVFWAK